jgi:hypothetical protein
LDDAVSERGWLAVLVVMPQRRIVLLAQLSALLAAGLLSGMALSGCGSGAAAITTGGADRSAALSTVERTVTATQPTTVRETQTEQQTVTTGPTIISPTVTTGESTSSSETPAWVWALVAVLGLGVVALVIVLLVRRRGPEEIPLEQRRQLVAAAVSSWVAQGWAIESQTDDSAILQREGQHVVLSVDSRGRVTSGPLGPPQQ